MTPESADFSEKREMVRGGVFILSLHTKSGFYFNLFKLITDSALSSFKAQLHVFANLNNSLNKLLIHKLYKTIPLIQSLTIGHMAHVAGVITLSFTRSHRIYI